MKGFVQSLSAYAIWGCFPLFFSLLSHVPAAEVLSFRIVFACVFAGLILLWQGRIALVAGYLKNLNAMLWTLLAAWLISINWYVFIWAVANQRVLEASLGYFMTPLVSLFLGRVILKESVNRWQAMAGLVAFLAIAFELVALGGIPWVSLVLAFSFGLYGLVRKQQPLNSLVGLTLETLWMVPVAVVFLVVVYAHEMPSYDVGSLSLLIISGVVTAVPLLLFAASVRSLNLVVAGFLMYLNPLMQFVSAVWILNESMPMQRYVTFVLVWIAMGLFITGLYLKHKQSLRVKKT